MLDEALKDAADAKRKLQKMAGLANQARQSLTKEVVEAKPEEVEPREEEEEEEVVEEKESEEHRDENEDFNLDDLMAGLVDDKEFADIACGPRNDEERLEILNATTLVAWGCGENDHKIQQRFSFWLERTHSQRASVATSQRTLANSSLSPRQRPGRSDVKRLAGPECLVIR